MSNEAKFDDGGPWIGCTAKQYTTELEVRYWKALQEGYVAKTVDNRVTEHNAPLREHVGWTPPLVYWGEITAAEYEAEKAKASGKPAEPPKQEPPKLGLYRARLSCRIGRDALEGKNVPPSINPTEYALYNLLHAVEEMATAMEEQMKGSGK